MPTTRTRKLGQRSDRRGPAEARKLLSRFLTLVRLLDEIQVALPGEFHDELNNEAIVAAFDFARASIRRRPARR